MKLKFRGKICPWRGICQCLQRLERDDILKRSIGEAWRQGGAFPFQLDVINTITLPLNSLPRLSVKQNIIFKQYSSA